jgi:hypothetical protein
VTMRLDMDAGLDAPRQIIGRAAIHRFRAAWR